MLPLLRALFNLPTLPQSLQLGWISNVFLWNISNSCLANHEPFVNLLFALALSHL